MSRIVGLMGLLLVLVAIGIVVSELNLFSGQGMVVGRAPASEIPELFRKIESSSSLRASIPAAITYDSLFSDVARIDSSVLDRLKSGSRVFFVFENKKIIFVPESMGEGNPLIIRGKAYSTAEGNPRGSPPHDMRIAINTQGEDAVVMGIIYANPGEDTAVLFSSSNSLPVDTIGITRQRLQDRISEPIPAPDGPGEEVGSDPPSSLVGGPPVTIDVMIVYNQGAVYDVGGVPNIQNWIALRTDETNQAYLNSNVNQQIRVVYTGWVDYDSSAAGDDHLGVLRGTSDGVMDEVHSIRNQFGADLVMLLIPYANWCGIAYLMNQSHLYNSSFAPSGFSVVITPCGNTYTFSHELGHNMGTRHDRAASGTTGAGPSTTAVSPNPYGFQNSPYWRTIMSYNCPGGCSRIPFFSNPAILYNDGVPTGIAPPNVNAADNSLTLNMSAITVANLKGQTVPPSIPFPPQNIQASDGTDNMIHLTWTHAAGSGITNYLLYRSTVNNSGNASLHETLDFVNRYTDRTNVIIGQTYYYWVRAQNSTGLSDFSSSNAGHASNSSSPPAVPSNVRASDGENTNRIDITWNVGPFTEEYRIYNLATAPNCNGTPIATLPILSSQYTHYASLPGNLVNFAVVAVNGAGASPCTGTDTGYISNCPAGEPDGGDLTCARAIDTMVYPDPASPNTADYSIYEFGNNWETTRNAATGSLNNAYGNLITAGTQKSSAQQYSISRSFFAFNPSPAFSNIPITGAELEWFVVYRKDFQNDAWGLLHILGGQQTNPLVPSAGDYSKCPANPSNQYAQPVDISSISTSLSNSAYRLRIPLNATGINALQQSVTTGGLFKLCAIEGHDYANVAPVWTGGESIQMSNVQASAYPATGSPDGPPSRLVVRYIQPAVTILSPPARVRASDGTYSNRVVVTWDTSIDTIRYEVWKSKENNSNTAKLVGKSDVLSFSDYISTLDMKYRYYYWVKAIGAAGTSDFSNSDQGWASQFGILSPLPPPAPTGVAATDGSFVNQVRVTWNSASGAVKYTIWRNITNESSTASRIGPDVTALSFSDSTAIPGTLYYYWVKSVNEEDVSSLFSTSDAGNSLATPMNVQASDAAFPDRVRVMWSASLGASAYEVWRSNSNVSSTASLQNGNITNGTQYDDLSASSGTLYYYWVKAKNVDVTGFSSSDSGYVGSLACGTICDVPGSINLGSSCRVTIYSNPDGDGSVTKYGNVGQSWESVRDAVNGDTVDATVMSSEISSAYGPVSSNNVFTIARTFLPFSIPSILATKQIQSTQLRYTVDTNPIVNQTNDTFDTLEFMSSTQASGSTLAVGDYSKCALSTNQRVTFAFDISYLSPSSTLTVPLNSNGISLINQSLSTGGYAKICAIEGHNRLESQPFPSGVATNKVGIKTPGNNDGESEQPALIVTYC